VSGANAAVALADRRRSGVDPLTVGSNSKPGAGSAAEESKAGLGSQGTAPSRGPRAGETGGGWVGSPRGWGRRVTEAVSVTKAMIRIGVPPCGQSSGNPSSILASRLAPREVADDRCSVSAARSSVLVVERPAGRHAVVGVVSFTTRLG
jgi:hypothetical protein